MADRQLRLFGRAKPLLERLGPEFFRSVPKRPGVYVMSRRCGEILYVGQSGNLRTRLGSYKNAHPDHLARRILRLIHSTDSITWEECCTRGLARVRENELIRLHRPKFNRMNVYPRGYGFIGVKADAERLTILRTRAEDESLALHGAFKGAAVQGYASLLRLLWSVLWQPASPFDFPRLLLASKPPSEFTFEFSGAFGPIGGSEIVSRIHEYLAGESCELIQLLGQSIRVEALGLFQRNLIESDLEVLTGFFESGPRRNHRLRREHGLGQCVIGQEELDDLIALGCIPHAI